MFRLSLPKQDEIDRNVWIDQQVSDRFDNHKNLIAVVVGQAGIGKSALAARFAERNDPTFTVNRIIFEISDFYRFARSLKHKEFLQVDESGATLDAQKWALVTHNLARWIVQTFRYKQIGLILCVPNFDMLDGTFRSMCHAVMRVVDFGVAEVYKVQNLGIGDITLLYIGMIKGYKLPSWWDEYEKKKDFYYNRLMEHIDMRTATYDVASKDPYASKSPVKVTQKNQSPEEYLGERLK